MRRILEWLEHFNTVTGIAILFGFPVSIFTGIGSAFWGHLEHLRWSYIAVLTLLVFGLTLWSWIGLIWLFDRAKKPMKNSHLEYAWGLLVEGAALGFDGPQHPIGCQLSLILKNRLTSPIKYNVISLKLEINHKTPDIDLESSIPGILMPNAIHNIYSKGYSHKTIDPDSKLSGTIELIIDYGHPDENYTRRMNRWYKFELNLGPSPFQSFLPMPDPLPPVVGKFNLLLGFVKQDEDVPLNAIKS